MRRRQDCIRGRTATEPALRGAPWCASHPPAGRTLATRLLPIRGRLLTCLSNAAVDRRLELKSASETRLLTIRTGRDRFVPHKGCAPSDGATPTGQPAHARASPNRSSTPRNGKAPRSAASRATPRDIFIRQPRPLVGRSQQHPRQNLPEMSLATFATAPTLCSCNPHSLGQVASATRY